MAGIIDKARRGWARFWALPWKWKAPVLAIVAVVIIGPFVSSGSDSDRGNDIQARPDVTEPATQTTTTKPTEEPTQPPNAEGNSDAEALYLSTVQQYAKQLQEQFGELSELVGTTPLDYDRLRELSDQILATLTEMQQIELPSDRWSDYHERWQHAVDAYIYGMEQFKAGLDAEDPSLIDEAGLSLSIGNELLNQARDLMPDD